MANRLKPLLLSILGGFGLRKERDNNAIKLLATPCWDSLQRDYPMTELDCSRNVAGRTGKLDVAIKADETVDASLQKIVDAFKQVGGQMLLTADHGNIEQMIASNTNLAHTAHLMNLAPLVHVGGSKPLLDEGNLADLAPTMLAILGGQKPTEMTGRSLIGQ